MSQFTDEEYSLLFNGLLRFEDTLKRSINKNLPDSFLRKYYEDRLTEVTNLKSRIALLIQRN
jgi:hypothetical protein